MSKDSFKEYFELYSAERKTFKQDYTPNEVATILSRISGLENTEDGTYSAFDMTAGTGALLVNKWHEDRIVESPSSYAPHRYLYWAEEISDTAIPYLIHNFCIRGMNAVVVHGDAIMREVKQVYLIQNSQDDFMAFSDLNVMPHSDDVMKMFNVSEWIEEGIDYIESGEVRIQPALPSRQRGKLEHEPPKFETVHTWMNAPRLKDVAIVERAKADKVYPKGSLVIQISATKGQMGLLESDGLVPSHYAVAIPVLFPGPYLFYGLQAVIPWWFSRVQEGLNIKAEDVAEMPLSIGKSIQKPIKYGQLSLFD